MDTLLTVSEQTPLGAPAPALPEAEERAGIRRVLLRRLRWDGFGGWLLVFFGFLTIDLIAWGRSIPLLVESLQRPQPITPILCVYALTRIWLLFAASRLLRRASDAARSVRFALAARLGFAVLLLFVSFLMFGRQSVSARTIMALSILSMACDVAWWFYFRLSRRVAAVLETRRRPQPAAGPEAFCPPYGAPEQEDPPPAPAGQEAAAVPARTRAAAVPGPTEYPPFAWLVLGAALMVLLWQAWRSAVGLQALASMLLFIPLETLLRLQGAWVTVVSFFMLTLSPLVAVGGFCLIFSLMFRIPGGRDLALRLGKLRIAFWALSVALTCAIGLSWEAADRPFGNAAWWFFLLAPTLIFEIALYAYARNAHSLRAAFPTRPGAKALAEHCARRVSGPDEGERLAAATWRAEKTAFTGLHGWLLFFCGGCAYSAVLFVFQMPAFNPQPPLLSVIARLFPPEGIQTARLLANVAIACVALLHIIACLLVLLRSRAAAPYARGLQLLMIFLCLALAGVLAVLFSGTRAQAGALFSQSFFSLFPAMALAFGWYRYFGASRRVFLTLPRVSSDNSQGDI